jgi:hypothetical protein
VRTRGSASTITISAAIDDALVGALEKLATTFAEPAPPPVAPQRRKTTLPPPLPRAKTVAVASPAPIADDGEFVLEAPTVPAPPGTMPTDAEFVLEAPTRPSPPVSVAAPPHDGEFVAEPPTTSYERLSSPVVANDDVPIDISTDIRPSRVPFFLGVVLLAAAGIAAFLMMGYQPADDTAASEPPRDEVTQPAQVPAAVPLPAPVVALPTTSPPAAVEAPIAEASPAPNAADSAKVPSVGEHRPKHRRHARPAEPPQP